MNYLIEEPVWWSEKVVGTLPRCLFIAAAQVVGAVFIFSELGYRPIQEMIPVGFFTLLLPLTYIYALRKVLLELKKKTMTGESHSPGRAD